MAAPTGESSDEAAIKFPFPFTPYNVQQRLMTQIFQVMDQSDDRRRADPEAPACVGIFESPTGTGKSLSILCSSLHWLLNSYPTKRRRSLEDEGCSPSEEGSSSSSSKQQNSSSGSDWVAAFQRQQQLSEFQDAERDKAELLEKMRVRAKIHAKQLRSGGDSSNSAVSSFLGGGRKKMIHKTLSNGDEEGGEIGVKRKKRKRKDGSLQKGEEERFLLDFRDNDVTDPTLGSMQIDDEVKEEKDDNQKRLDGERGHDERPLLGTEVRASGKAMPLPFMPEASGLQGHAQTSNYFEHYKGRFRFSNAKMIRKIIFVLKQLKDFLLTNQRGGGEGKGEWEGRREAVAAGGKDALKMATTAATTATTTSMRMMTLNDFLFATKIDNIDLFELCDFIHESGIIKKLNGFLDYVASKEGEGGEGGGAEVAGKRDRQARADEGTTASDKHKEESSNPGVSVNEAGGDTLPHRKPILSVLG
eukprot:jgi/Bigna1/130420/aug1.11_g5128